MARASKRRAKKTNVVSVDFTDVESGGGGFKIKEGPYLMAVESVEDTESDKGNQMFKFTFVGKEKAAKGKKFYSYCVYDPPDSLWKLRSLLEALGVEVPDGPMDIDTDELIDLEIIGIVGDEEYQGKTTSKLQDFEPIDGAGEDEEAEEEDEDDGKKGKGKKTVAKKGKKTKELEAISAEEVKAMDDDEMEETVEKYELDVELKDHKTPRRKASAIIAALEEKELLADD